jgi:hypothetical protein
MTPHKGFAVCKQAEVGRVVAKIDGDGAVGSRRFGYYAHMSPPVIRGRQRMRYDEGKAL